jgi:hypothetical protein
MINTWRTEEAVEWKGSCTIIVLQRASCCG